MVTHGNLLHNLEASATLAGHDPDRSASPGCRSTTIWDLIDGVLQPAFSGFPVWLMAPASFLQRPARWLRAISRLRATHSGAPNFAYDLCVRRIDESERASLDLSTWDIAYNGSEPVRDSERSTRSIVHSHRAGFAGSRSDRHTVSRRQRCSSRAAGRVKNRWHFVRTPPCWRKDVLPVAEMRPTRVSLIACGQPAPGLRIEIVDPIRADESGQRRNRRDLGCRPQRGFRLLEQASRIRRDVRGTSCRTQPIPIMTVRSSELATWASSGNTSSS